MNVAGLLLVGALAQAAPAGPRAALAAVVVTDRNGKIFELPKAPVWVVTVWASNCAPCAGQLQNVDALARAYAGDAQVSFLAVDVDAYVGTASGVREKALKSLKLELPLVQDAQAQLIRTIEAWGAQGPSASPRLPTTVTMPAVYVVDGEGKTRGDLKYYRDTKPTEFVEKYRPLVERAKAGRLAGESGSAAVATTVEQENRDVAVARGKVRLKYPQMSDGQIARTLPDVRKQLAQMFPKAKDAQLDAMVAQVAQAMKKGEPVEFDSQ